MPTISSLFGTWVHSFQCSNVYVSPTKVLFNISNVCGLLANSFSQLFILLLRDFNSVGINIPMRLCGKMWGVIAVRKLAG